MTATISLVSVTRPEGLLDAAGRLTASVTELTTQIGVQRASVAELPASWEGDAATAALSRAERDLDRQQKFGTRLEAMASGLRSGGANLATLRSEILSVATQAASLGGIVSDDGTVRPFSVNQLMTPALAAAYTSTLKGLLDQFDAVDAVTAQAIDQPLGEAPEVPTNKPFKWTDEDLYEGDPSSADINQDAIGDCYLLASMGALANADPQRIKNKISYNPATGEFDVTLWDGQQWRHITVTQADIDANIAARGGSGVDTANPGEVNRNAALWPAVIESAYAKLKAPGQSLPDGIGKGAQTSAALEALTGNRGINLDPTQEWFRTLNIDQQITQALQNHQPVTISTGAVPGSLVGGHAYIVEAIEGTGSDARVTLRNPWAADNGQPVTTVRLGDLVGTGILDGLRGIGPMQNVNIGQL